MVFQYEDDNNLAKRISLYSYGTNRVAWTEWFFHLVPLKRGMKVLDIGCGNARLWTSSPLRVSNGITVVLADKSPGMIQAARRTLGSLTGDWEFCTASVEHLPFDSETFDVVIANHMLYHVTDMRSAVHELARVLKPHGVAFASTNGNGHLRQLCKWAVDSGLSAAAEKLHRNIKVFGLESGTPVLQACFGKVVTHRHDDALSIPNVEPILDYVESMQLPRVGEGIERLRILLEKVLKKNGTITITTDTGVLEAFEPLPSQYAI